MRSMRQRRTPGRGLPGCKRGLENSTHPPLRRVGQPGALNGVIDFLTKQ